MLRRLVGSAAVGGFLVFAGCATKAAPESALARAAETPAAIDYQTIVDTPDRPDTDLLADEPCKPALVLGLVSPQPGDTIVEIEAGSGYYTELLARVVGPSGKVYMQNPAVFDAFLGDAVSKRIDGRLSNVIYLKSTFDSLAVADASADLVTWFQGPHELWYTPEGATEGLGDPVRSFAEIVRVLKRGGRFAAIDHVAPPGSPPTTGGDTHRIDPAIIRQLAEAAGLVLETESDILRNPEDEGLTNVFDPAIRGRTDQAILIFVKP